MDARGIEQWIVAAFLVVTGFCFPAFADLAPIIYSRDFDLPLRDPIKQGESEMAEATIDVNNSFIITDLNVRVDITHTHVFDLQLILQGPTGAWLCLNKYDFEKDFFEGENYTNTVFDDEAELSIEDANAPFSGRFKPEPGYLLGCFDGTDAFGIWRLQIYDMWPADTGTLDHIDLIFNTPEPASAVILGLGGLFFALRRRHQ